MNSFMENLKEANNYKLTENGAIAHSHLKNEVYQMFALAGAYRQRSDEDCILLFKNAFEEDEELAMKCLFWSRDCRGGAGERRFFRTCFKWLANEHPEAAIRNLKSVPFVGRWDDLIYSCVDTKVQDEALKVVKTQLALDIQCKTPSLLAKWMPSCNCSSSETKRVANIVRQYLGMTQKEYRKTLSVLRERIKVLERLMSAGRFDEIEFDKVPSKAGLIYRNAFARRDILAKKYEAFIKNENTKVNAKTLFPYEIIRQARYCQEAYGTVERKALDKYWENLENPFESTNGKSNILCVCDTSGSMTWTGGASKVVPIDVAISLSMICAERAGGAFKDHYISFSTEPQLIKIEGVDLVDKVERIYETNLCQSTNLIGTFEMLREIALQSKPEDIPSTICIISDMEIDEGARGYDVSCETGKIKLLTDMEAEREKWRMSGLEMPSLVYWNVNARHDTFLDLGPNVSCVSGFSQNMFEQILKGKTGWDLCLDKLLSDRYKDIH